MPAAGCQSALAAALFARQNCARLVGKTRRTRRRPFVRGAAMTGNRQNLVTRKFVTLRGFFSAAAAGLLAAALAAAFAMAPDLAVSQTAQPAPQQPAPNTTPQQPGLFPAQPAPAFNPGFIYAFGRWWDTARIKLEGLTKQSNAAAKKAATAITRLPGFRVIEVHQRCRLAPNGAPDCRTAAANACRRKGFSGGNPVNVQSGENCPPSVWMSGRVPAPSECPQ